MSPKPTGLDSSVQQLVDEGYEVEILHSFLLIHSVPYVTPEREIKLGTLVCAYSGTPGVAGRPNDHTVWFAGATPCKASGEPLTEVINNSNECVLFDQFKVNHYFSNKPTSNPTFPNTYHEKISHYAEVLAAQARVIDCDADPKTGKAFPSRDVDSVFRYGDSASSRAGITAIAQKLQLAKIAIVGAGGTGSYILDLVAKTPVREIHLFDEDEFKRHNAFRAPGAATLEMLETRPAKVDYLQGIYANMHKGVVAHPYHLTSTNIGELEQFNFVFVCVDDGPARGLICGHLRHAGIPFIDVGMAINKQEETSSLRGTCRVTLGTVQKNDHLDRLLDIEPDQGDALYRSNIQVADMNALNAALAVIRWKQHCGFYSDQELAHNQTFTVALQSLARSEFGATE
ncbi:hypothetical protein Pres01_47810 [Metapseudomonas resinovorans]|uniref:ThiF family adenylyltransferase n=1 Tax=Metapseudomonas resinovorans TaxID=53412 RepID=UPI000984339A|nr:ThiF family adenylyltransferase [Pseudomonas resinovorans]GLZ88730.1 hypothetical protein Pres01_47810 [Pseudomonas resinovorans]